MRSKRETEREMLKGPRLGLGVVGASLGRMYVTKNNACNNHWCVLCSSCRWYHRRLVSVLAQGAHDEIDVLEKRVDSQAREADG